MNTPRTENALTICCDTCSEWHGAWVSADFARQLELENQRLREAGNRLYYHDDHIGYCGSKIGKQCTCGHEEAKKQWQEAAK